MSDTPQGPGWWQASDGKWYPPTPAPSADPSASRVVPQWWHVAAAGVLGLLLGGGIGAAASSDNGGDEVPSAVAEETTTATGEATESAAPDDPASVEPADTQASPFVGGTATMPLPTGDPGEVSVIAVGPIGPSVPVIVRNNTAETVSSISLSGSARDAGGSLIASGEDQGVLPSLVQPGEIAFGYVFLDLDNPPAGTTFEAQARGQEPGGGPGDVDLVMSEANLAGDQIVGALTNVTDDVVSGPLSVMVLCLDAAGMPTMTSLTYADQDDIAPGATATFAADLFGRPCPTFLVAGNGYNF